MDISGAVIGLQERLRAQEPASLKPFQRWIAALAVEGHGEEEGASWVTFTWPPGPPLGWRWGWGRRRPPGEDLLSAVVDDLIDDLAHGGISKPGVDHGPRWLLRGQDSIKPPLVVHE